MKNPVTILLLLIACALSTSSCYTYTFDVGEGPQTGIEEEGKNHYFIFGLVDGKQSDPVQMANGADDYRVKVEHTFIDGLLNTITFGIYNPTTTVVTR